MRKLIVVTAFVLLAACSSNPEPMADASQHPGQIGGEQATKNASLATE